jgi:ATP-dependent RNA helicase DeaD
MERTFDLLGISRPVLGTINQLGYEEPTPVQAIAIPLLIEGRDIIAQAQTGTGKTAAFAIPLVERVDPAIRKVQAIVVAPTRELAVQVAESVHALGRDRGISVLSVYGGQPYERQIRGLRGGAQVVVGTPGRVIDHIRRGNLILDSVRMAVLDEADEMLDMGFSEDIEFILEQLPAERQTAFFSATMPPRIEALAGRYLRNPERINIVQDNRTPSQTRQFFHVVPYRAKFDVISRILDFEQPKSAIVFCRTRREVDDLAQALQARGFPTAAIHGDVSQAQRERQLRDFRDGRAELLIATDVAARGLDIPDVSHVINYDIPDDAEAYVHRVGRTGRMGRKGEAITLVTPRETRLLQFIEKQTGRKLKPLRLPTPGDIESRRRGTFLAALNTVLESGDGNAFTAEVQLLAAERDPLEIAAAALQLAYAGPPPPRPEDADAEGAPAPSAAKTSPAPAASPGEHIVLRLDIGQKEGIRPREIVERLTEAAGVPPFAFGAIERHSNYTLITVQAESARIILERAATIRRGARDVRVEVAPTA